MSRAENGLLDSWKEIAAYLGRDLRTVRRWEKTRALPVHRVPGGGRRAVYAYRNEITKWLSESQEREEWNGGQARSDAPPVIAFNPPLSPETNSITETPATTTRRSLAIWLAIPVLVAVLSLSLIWTLKSKKGFISASSDPIEITSVSPILPQRDQTMVVRGRGFGLHTPFSNTDTPYLAIRNTTRLWAAGRIIPQNWDEVMVDVKSWEDRQITISGFSGAYGSGEWKLLPGDQIEVAVWNPQSGRGPALYHLSVSPPAN